MSTITRRAAVVLAVVALALIPAAPAAADPAVPTNYRGEVLALEPAVDGAEVRVSGGDAFLVGEAAPGTEVVVLGYGDTNVPEEPYLRIDPEGTVWANVRSPAYYMNDDRFSLAFPPEADAAAEPRWERVGDDGRYAWHDHRTHWMSPVPPRQVQAAPDQRQRIMEWSVPIVVDGEQVEVRGATEWIPSESPAPPIAVALLAVAAVVAAWRTWGRTGAAGALLLGTVGALAIAVGDVIGAVTDPEPLFIGVGAAALATGGAAAALALERRRPAESERLIIAAGVFVLAWGVPRLDAVTKPVIPNPLPDVLVRLGIAGAFALGVVAAALVVWDRVRRSRATG